MAATDDASRTFERPNVCALFGDRLRQWRKETGTPLKQVAAGLGVSVSIVSAWERGARFPSGQHIDSLAEYTGLAACKFFCESGQRCIFSDRD